MKIRLLILPMILGVAATAIAQDDVLQIFENNVYTPLPWSQVDNITFDSKDQMILFEDADGYFTKFSVKDPLDLISGPTLPLIEVNTDVFVKEVTSKVDYLTGKFSLKGFGEYDDNEVDVSIRGRGNSSWVQFPKKPYRLKFSKKQKLCGLTSAKNYVLLANYTDPSFVQFALATKVAKWFGLPFTNTVVPVDMVFNGIYKGTYLLTNKPGINAGSVDIDEGNSVMWEIDTNFDEDYKFTSSTYRLPVMLVDPDMEYATFQNWRTDYENMERAVKESRASEVIDLDAYARFILIYEIFANDELKHPKSLKLYKEAGDKYTFGPIWDFDCAFGYYWADRLEWHERYTTWDVDKPSQKIQFLKDINKDPITVAAVKKYWDQVKDKLPELIEYIDECADRIRNSANRNKAVWPDLDGFDKSIESLKNWLTLRYKYLPNIIATEYR